MHGTVNHLLFAIFQYHVIVTTIALWPTHYTGTTSNTAFAMHILCKFAAIYAHPFKHTLTIFAIQPPNSLCLFTV